MIVFEWKRQAKVLTIRWNIGEEPWIVKIKIEQATEYLEEVQWQ